MRLQLVDGGINWNWYLVAEFDETEKTVTILCYDRFHKFDMPNHPKVSTFQPFTLMEDDNRIVYGIRYLGVEYLVLNPDYIFGYKDVNHFELEK